MANDELRKSLDNLELAKNQIDAMENMRHLIEPSHCITQMVKDIDHQNKLLRDEVRSIRMDGWTGGKGKAVRLRLLSYAKYLNLDLQHKR